MDHRNQCEECATVLVVVVSFKGDLGVSPDCLLYTEDISQLFYLPIDQYLETTPFLLVAACRYQLLVTFMCKCDHTISLSSCFVFTNRW